MTARPVFTERRRRPASAAVALVPVAKGSAANSTSGGDGGSGKYYDITGESVPYGGGGGGGSAMYGTTYGSGGFGCCGDGSKGEPNNAKCEETGSGGGGTSGTTRCSGMLSGAGGSGVVIIRYLTPVVTAPVASFTADPTYGTAPLNVTFNDTSSGDPAGWLWDFGDGDSSEDQHPVHTYPDNGTYTVRMNAINAVGNDTVTNARYIHVGQQDKIGVYRNWTHMFHLDYNGNGTWDGITTDRRYDFGTYNDIPVAGDWNGDGITEIGVYRNATHRFMLDYNGNGI